MKSAGTSAKGASKFTLAFSHMPDRKAFFSLCLFAFQTLVNASTPFQPIDGWRTAILNGDREALARNYGSQAMVQAGRTRNTLDDELAFWSGLKTSGLTALNPKILEVTEQDGNKRFLLRVTAQIGGAAVVAAMQQIWHENPDGWKMIASARSPKFVADAHRTLPEPPIPNTQLYPSPENAQTDIDEALAQATKEHKRVILVFGGNWCYDCHVLDTTFHSKEFADLVDSHFIVVHVNIGEDGKANSDLAKRLSIVLDKGVPTLGVLAADGTILYTQKEGEFEDSGKLGPTEVRAFLEKWELRTK
jgi:hypothetical protein